MGAAISYDQTFPEGKEHVAIEIAEKMCLALDVPFKLEALNGKNVAILIDAPGVETFAIEPFDTSHPRNFCKTQAFRQDGLVEAATSHIFIAMTLKTIENALGVDLKISDECDFLWKPATQKELEYWASLVKEGFPDYAKRHAAMRPYDPANIIVGYNDVLEVCNGNELTTRGRILDQLNAYTNRTFTVSAKIVKDYAPAPQFKKLSQLAEELGYIPKAAPKLSDFTGCKSLSETLEELHKRGLLVTLEK